MKPMRIQQLQYKHDIMLKYRHLTKVVLNLKEAL